MVKLDTFEQALLEGWEDIHKKSQLTLWIFLSLKDGPKHMAQMKQFIHSITNGNIIADDQSMYRALRRFKEGRMVDYTLRIGKGGPDLKQYYLTPIGQNVLQEFINRQVTVFYSESVQKLVNKDK